METKSNIMSDSQILIFRKLLENFEKRLEIVEKVSISQFFGNDMRF